MKYDATSGVMNEAANTFLIGCAGGSGISEEEAAAGVVDVVVGAFGMIRMAYLRGKRAV